jgi:hypothetical protein
MDPNQLTNEVEDRERASAEEVPAWEEIATGRFMPRRIRGSFRGRVLG